MSAPWEAIERAKQAIDGLAIMAHNYGGDGPRRDEKGCAVCAAMDSALACLDRLAEALEAAEAFAVDADWLDGEEWWCRNTLSAALAACRQGATGEGQDG